MAAEKVTGWAAPIAVPETQAAVGLGDDPAALVFVPAGDGYNGASHGQLPVSVPEPSCVLIFGGAAVIAMAARRLRISCGPRRDTRRSTTKERPS